MREPDPFLYSGRWRGLRAIYLKRHPYCAECGSPAQHVDHVISRRVAPNLALEWSNLRAVCVSCHTKKTNAMDGAGWAGSVATPPHRGVESYGVGGPTDRDLVKKTRVQNPPNGGPPRG